MRAMEERERKRKIEEEKRREEEEELRERRLRQIEYLVIIKKNWMQSCVYIWGGSNR